MLGLRDGWKIIVSVGIISGGGISTAVSVILDYEKRQLFGSALLSPSVWKLRRKTLAASASEMKSYWNACRWWLLNCCTTTKHL